MGDLPLFSHQKIVYLGRLIENGNLLVPAYTNEWKTYKDMVLQ